VDTTFSAWINTVYNDVALDKAGNVYVAAVEGYPVRRGYVSKISSTGQHLWAHHYQGTQSYDEVHALTVSDSGYIYAAGILNFTMTTTGNHFISKLDTSGSELWQKQFMASKSWQAGIATDVSGSVYLVSATTTGDGYDFDPGPGVDSLATWGIPAMFLIKLDGGGDYEWATLHYVNQLQSPKSYGLNVAVDDMCHVYITGAAYNGNIDFDPGSGSNSQSMNGLFLERITCNTTSVQDRNKVNADVKVFPNPAAGAVNVTSSHLIKHLQLTDVLGRVVYSGSSSARKVTFQPVVSTGVYYLTVDTDKGRHVEKLVIQAH
jgi:hypothetical protein